MTTTPILTVRQLELLKTARAGNVMRHSYRYRGNWGSASTNEEFAHKTSERLISLGLAETERLGEWTYLNVTVKGMKCLGEI